MIGDINKDGLDDLAVGAPADLTPGAGRVYIYLGTKNGITTTSQPVQVLTLRWLKFKNKNLIVISLIVGFYPSVCSLPGSSCHDLDINLEVPLCK